VLKSQLLSLDRAFGSVQEIGSISAVVKAIVEVNKPADSPGAKAYDMHVSRNMARARKNPRIRQMIQG
jgi:hypothetical protein